MGDEANLVRLASRRLSGYLCGTHSGLLALSASGRRLAARRPEAISALHRSLNPSPSSEAIALGGATWEPDEQSLFADELRRALAAPGVIDLVFFGSQAHGGRTAFSDVDAVLVIDNDVADNAEQLRRLRPNVIAAQRTVLRRQPLQHHGFEVATPRLLIQAEGCLALPVAALAGTASLKGATIAAGISGAPRSQSGLRDAVSQLRRLRAWPRHPWHAYLSVATFELLPALFFQANGMPIAKRDSFVRGRSEFGDAWWPYEELAIVRERWPRLQYPSLQRLVFAARNPWAAVAGWRRLPVAAPDELRSLLTPSLLTGLQTLGESMAARTT